MKNPFLTAPRCVQWAAVILGALPVFDIVVASRSLSVAQYFAPWQPRLVSSAMLIALGAGLLFGINLARLLGIGLVLLGTITRVVGWYYLGAISFSVVYDIVWLVSPWISIALCYLPPANRYFSGREATVNPVEAPASGRKGFIVLGLVTSGLLVGIKYLSPQLKEASYTSPEIRAEGDRIHQEYYEREMGNNCRRLATAMSQYFFERPTLTKATLSDLVGPDKFVGKLVPIAGETYPHEFWRDGELVVILNDGARLVYDAKTGETKRQPPPP